ncbi:MAG: hypothetical protein ABSG51_07510 [Terracidiphilus sp.]|jgi:hypothetical protein
MIENNSQFFSTLKSLVDAWCDRRCLSALRRILVAYPMLSGLTDEWGELTIALENVRAFAGDQITESDLQQVGDAIAFGRKVVGASEQGIKE